MLSKYSRIIYSLRKIWPDFKHIFYVHSRNFSLTLSLLSHSLSPPLPTTSLCFSFPYSPHQTVTLSTKRLQDTVSFCGTVDVFIFITNLYVVCMLQISKKASVLRPPRLDDICITHILGLVPTHNKCFAR